MKIFFTKPWLKVISGLFTNLAAGWFGVAFITPNFANISSQVVFILLTKDIVVGMMCVFAAVKIEEVLEE